MGASAQLSDDQLVARCRDGDPVAWNQLVERFSRYVFAIATQAYNLSSQDAEDVFQEVFTRTYTHLHTLRDDSAIRPWIGQLTRRLAVDKIRGARREQPADVLPEEAEPDRALTDIERAFDVHAAMETLPEHCHEILDRFFARDESYQVIGEALEIPAGTIASRISRCLAKLRQTMEGR